MLIRNQRSKGFKVKHALQISMLLAICIWLVYQLQQHSNDKKALEEEESSENTTGDMQISELGRKGLHPQVAKVSSVDIFIESPLDLEKDEEESDEEVVESKAEEIEEEPEVMKMIQRGKRKVKIRKTTWRVKSKMKTTQGVIPKKPEKSIIRGDNAFSGVNHNTHIISNRLEIGSLRRVKQEEVEIT